MFLAVIVFLGLSSNVFAERVQDVSRDTNQSTASTITFEGYFNIGEKIYSDGTSEIEYYLFVDDRNGTKPYRINFSNLDPYEFSGHYVQVHGISRASANTSANVDNKYIGVAGNIDASSIIPSPSHKEFNSKVDAYEKTVSRAVPSTLKTVAILSQYSGNSATPHTKAYFQDRWFTGTDSLKAYWEDTSYGAITLSAGTVDGTGVVDWQSLPSTSAQYAADEITRRNNVITNADPFVDFNGADNIIQNTGPQIGGPGNNGDDPDLVIMVYNDQFADGNYAFAFFDPQPITTAEGNLYVYLIHTPDNGAAFPVGVTFENGVGVVAHEMGHDFEMRHTTVTSGIDVYADEWSLMSGGGPDGPPGMIAFNRNQAGWIPSADIVDVPAGTEQTVTLDFLSVPSPGANYLMATAPFGLVGEYYTVEARKDTTFDQTPQDQTGIMIYYYKATGHSGSPESTAPVMQVDTTASGDYDNADLDILPPATFTQNGVTFEVISSTSTSITVKITNSVCTIESDAKTLALAMGINESDIICASLNGSDSVGYHVQSSPLTKFPTQGNTFSIISSGCAVDASSLNSSPSSSCSNSGLDTSSGQDMTQLALKLATHGDANRVSFDWQFLSEEFPEFVDSLYNDAFLCELGETNFTISESSSTITADNNKCKDKAGNLVTINSSGLAQMSSIDSVGTTYDGATGQLTTRIPYSATDSTITLIFSVFDVGDSAFDTTVFLDNFKYESGSIGDPPVITAYTGEISGSVWDDTDGDGNIDAKEAYAPGVHLTLYRISDNLDVNQLIDIATTSNDDIATPSIDEGGKYGFDNLVPGFYRITAENTGKVQTFPYSGQSQYVNVHNDQNVNNVNFGFYDSTPGNVFGKVWNDVNENQLIDNGELGIANATVCNRQVSECKTTDENGGYSFTNLAPGSHTFYIYPDSLAVNTTPINVVVTISAGQTVNDVNFGQVTPTPPPPVVTVVDPPIPQYHGLPTVFFGSPTTYTANVGPLGHDHCDANKPVAIKLVASFSDGTTFSTMTTLIDDSNEIWSGTLDAFRPSYGLADLKFYIDCPDDTAGFPEDLSLISGEDEIQQGGNIYVVPNGTIKNACTGDLLTGAAATLSIESPPGTGNFIAPSSTDIIPTTNPQTTGSDGAFGWVVVTGNWIVTASYTGYITNTSSELAIPPAVTDLDILLTPNAGCPNTPGAPTGLGASTVSGSQINLLWTAPANDGGSPITGYKIEQKIYDGVWTTLVSNTGSTTTSYSVTKLDRGTEYFFRVSARNSSGPSIASGESSTFTLVDAPSGLLATGSSSSTITLEWIGPNGVVTGYKIEQKLGSGSFTVLKTNTETSDETYTSTGLTAGTEYTYRVSAINSGGTSATSNTSGAITSSSDSAPGAPTDLDASTVSGSQISLTWTAPVDTGTSNIIGYKIQRESPIGHGFTTIVANSGTTGTTYSNDNLDPETEYNYRVSAINHTGTSGTSNNASATTAKSDLVLMASGTATLKSAVKKGTNLFDKGPYTISVKITANINSVSAGVPKLSHIAGTFSIDGAKMQQDVTDHSFTKLKLTVDKKLKYIKWTAKEGSGQFNFLKPVDFTAKTDKTGNKSTIAKIVLSIATFKPKVTTSNIDFN